MEKHFKGEKSEKKQLPGGGTQGTILGIFLFLILINGAGFKDNIKNTGEKITKKGINKRKPIGNIHMKFIDNMTIAESIFLNEKPMLDKIVAYTQEHQMKINKDKTKAILFNNALKNDFHSS